MFTQTKRACSLLKMIKNRWPVSVPIKLICKTGVREAVEASQKWVCNLHFWLYLGQFLTDYQNFPLEAYENCNLAKKWVHNCAICAPASTAPFFCWTYCNLSFCHPLLCDCQWWPDKKLSQETSDNMTGIPVIMWQESLSQCEGQI